MKNIVIFGASGHGSVVLDSIEKEGRYNVIGLIDSYKEKGGEQNGYEILGNKHDLPVLIEKFDIFGGIVAIGDNWTRKTIVDKLTRIVPDFNYVTAIHPNAIIGIGVKIGRGTVIMPGTIVNANCSIGDFCILNTSASLDHDSKMDDFSSLAPRVCTGANLKLGKFSAICLGANIIESITIEEHSVVGAGSLVVNDVESHVVAYGSPSKVITSRVVGEKYLSAAYKVHNLPHVVD